MIIPNIGYQYFKTTASRKVKTTSYPIKDTSVYCIYIIKFYLQSRISILSPPNPSHLLEELLLSVCHILHGVSTPSVCNIESQAGTTQHAPRKAEMDWTLNIYEFNSCCKSLILFHRNTCTVNKSEYLKSRV